MMDYFNSEQAYSSASAGAGRVWVSPPIKTLSPVASVVLRVVIGDRSLKLRLASSDEKLSVPLQLKPLLRSRDVLLLALWLIADWSL